MRNAAVAGLIAGIVWGIAGIFISFGTINSGLPYWNVEVPTTTPIMEIVLPPIIFNIIFGIFFGIIFSKIYNLIPGKTHVLKGLVFGLGLYFLMWIRLSFLAYSYGYHLGAISCLVEVTPIIYGLILGILYKAPIQILETKHDMKDGLIPGAITGFIFGIVLIITFVMASYFGFVFWFKEAHPEYLTDIEFMMSQFGSHTVINMFIMTCYGAIYVGFYDAIPGKSLIKGAMFGFIIWLITELYHSLNYLVHGSPSGAIAVGVTFPDTYLGVGILLEGFYNKRWQAFPIAAAIFLFSILKYYILAMWIYPH